MGQVISNPAQKSKANVFTEHNAFGALSAVDDVTLGGYNDGAYSPGAVASTLASLEEVFTDLNSHNGGTFGCYVGMLLDPAANARRPRDRTPLPPRAASRI